MHSGWGVLVCISGNVSAPEIIDRRRIAVVEPTMEGGKQPYHFAATLPLEEAECHLQRYAAVSERLALEAIREMLDAVTARNYRVVGCVMLLASGHALPALPNILVSHALVHTAEKEFFRKVAREACERCRIPVVGFRERELDEHANATFGRAAAGVRRRISDLRSPVGSPDSS
jgi:hypothetical protein